MVHDVFYYIVTTKMKVSYSLSSSSVKTCCAKLAIVQMFMFHHRLLYQVASVFLC